MVKRLSKVAALLAAGALFFGGTFLSCSSDGLPPELSDEPSAPPPEEVSTYDGPDSWNFVSQTDSVAWVTSLKSNTASGGDETRTLSADIAIRGADDKATLTLLKDTAFDYTSKFSNGKNKSDPSFSYIDPELGIRIKSTGMKIAGVTGKVNLKIVWVGGSSRGIGIFKGTSDSSPTIKNVDTTKTQISATNGSTQTKTLAVYEQDDIDTVIDLSSATDLYIVADNNIYIKSVALTSAENAVTTVTLKVPTAVDDTTGTITWGDVADYDIGGTSITNTALETKIKANEGNNASITSALTLVKGTLKAEAEAEGATDFTVSNDMFKLAFISEAPAASDAADTAAASGLATVTSNTTVYVWYVSTDAFDDAVTAATATGVTANWTFTASEAKDAAWFKELVANTDAFALDSDSEVKGKVKDGKTAAITPTAGKGATFTFQRTGQSIETGGSNGWKTGTKKPDDYVGHATITVTDSCTVKISGKEGGGARTDGTIRGFVVNDGTSDVVSYTQADGASSSSAFEKSFDAVAGKTYTIKAGGVNFHSITCTPAE